MCVCSCVCVRPRRRCVRWRRWTRQVTRLSAHKMPVVSAALQRDGAVSVSGPRLRGAERHGTAVGRPYARPDQLWGSRAFTGGGRSIEPPKTGGVSGKRAQSTGPLISYYELWRQRRRNFFPAFTTAFFFLFFFPPNPWQMMTFLKTR